MTTTKTVIVVDDEVSIREFLALLLRNRGYRVLVAGDARGMKLMLRKELPDCVLLDAMLPGKTGFEICEDLRHDPRTCRIKIMMVSGIGAGLGRSDEDLRERVQADEYVSKPFEMADLMGRLEALIGCA